MAKRKKPTRVTKAALPDIGHLNSFAMLAEHLARPSTPTGVPPGPLSAAVQKAGLPLSTAVYAIKQLEAVYGRRLISRSREAGTAVLTAEGEAFAKRASTIVGQCRELLTGRDYDFVRVVIGTTETLRNRVLTSAVLAARFYLRKEFPQARVSIRVEALNHPVVLQRVREGRCDFGLLWQLPSERDAYPDISFAEVHSGVEYVALALPAIRSSAGEDLRPPGLVQLFEETQKDRKLSLGQVTSKALVRTRLAVVETEPDDSLRHTFFRAADSTRIVTVGSYEEVLACVRMSIADLGWAPRWFADRRMIETRELMDKDKPFTRGLRVCRFTGTGSVGPDQREENEIVKKTRRVIEEFIRYPVHQRRLVGEVAGSEPDQDVLSDVAKWVAGYRDRS